MEFKNFQKMKKLQSFFLTFTTFLIKNITGFALNIKEITKNQRIHLYEKWLQKRFF